MIALWATVAVTVGGQELFLRWKSPSLMDQRYRGEFDVGPLGEGRLFTGAPDPEYGWVAFRYPPPETAEIVAAGDSFTYGAEAPIHADWPSILAMETGKKVANLGVCAYGADQSGLMAIRKGLALRPRTVVWAIFEDDLRRAGCSAFGSVPKPRITAQDGVVSVAPPLWATGAELASWWAERQDTSRSSLVVAAVRGAWERQVSDRLEERRILRTVTELARILSRRARLLVVMIPHAAPTGEFYARAMTSLREAEIDVLDLEAELPADRSGLYMWPTGRAGPAGHFTALGNAMAARLIAARLYRARA